MTDFFYEFDESPSVLRDVLESVSLDSPSPPRTPKKGFQSTISLSPIRMPSQTPPRSPGPALSGGATPPPSIGHAFESPGKGGRSPFKDNQELKRAVNAGELSFESLRSPKKADLNEPAVVFTLEEEFTFPAKATPQPAGNQLTSPLKQASPVKKIRCDLLEDTPRRPLGDCTNLLTSPIKRVSRNNADKAPTTHDLLGMAKKEPKPAGTALPRFYFPKGKAQDNATAAAAEMLAIVKPLFKSGPVDEERLASVCKRCELPRFITGATFRAICSKEGGTITFEEFSRFWTELTKEHTDTVSRVFGIMSQKGKDFLTPTDFEDVIFGVLYNHPGLSFLIDCLQFQDKYVMSVILRIYYKIGLFRTAKMTLAQFRQTNFVEVLRTLEQEEDINACREFFSYKHFYVLYCRFWELDKDHDGLISVHDLARHDGGAISRPVLTRIIQGYGKPLTGSKPRTMTFEDFCWFLLSEEDKRNHTSIDYWFRCLDLDGDGVISLYELEYFYQHQYAALLELKVDPAPFSDFLCQTLDLVNPAVKNYVTAVDLKKCKLAHLFFDSLFNVNKFLYHESKDTATIRAEMRRAHLSDWVKFAEHEYDILAQEEEEAAISQTFKSDSWWLEDEEPGKSF